MSKLKYTTMQNIKFLHHYIFRDKLKKYIFFSTLVSVLNVLITLMPALLPAYIVTLLLNDTPLNKIIINVIIYLFIIQSIAIINKRLESNIVNTIDMERLVKCTDYYEIMMDTEFTNVESPKRIQAFFDGLDTFYDDFHIGLTHLIVDSRILVQGVIGLIVYCFFIANVSLTMTVLLILITILQVFVNSKHTKWISSNIDKWKPIEARLMYIYRESTAVKNGKDVRLFNMEKWIYNKIETLICKRQQWVKKEVRSEFRVKFTKRVLTFIKFAIVYFFALSEVKNGKATTEFIIVVSLITGVDHWITSIFDHFNYLSINNITISKFREVLDFENESVKKNIQDSDNQTIVFNELRFENVYYKYNDSNDYIISDLCLTIKKGEKLALVGKNGAGKSTLIKLMCKLYKPTKGTIYLNNKDLNSYSTNEIWDIYSIMFQDNTTFAFSVAENISCRTLEEINSSRVEECLKASDIYGKIMEHPKGIHAPMTKEFKDDGIVLSGGESQKFMFARMLYDNGAIAILDEPTAALDAVAESEFYDSFNALLANKTCLFISHRLSSTKFCDRIILFEKGKIIGEGTHDELICTNAVYSNLYNIQASYYMKEPSEIE